MNHVMIDIETLAVSTDAVILSIGAVLFNLTEPVNPGKTFYAVLDQQSQLKYNRNIDPITVEWWSFQDAAVRTELFHPTNPVGFVSALIDLDEFLDMPNLHVWTQGPHFDIAILQHAYESIDLVTPWHFSKVRDCRTITSLFPSSFFDSIPRPMAHNALADCHYQINKIQKAFAHLSINL